MSRYIDADALIEGIANKFYDEASTAEAFDMVNKVCDYITDAPSIDIVRCKECRWLDKGENESCSWSMCTRHIGQYINVDDEAYCSYGEREGE